MSEVEYKQGMTKVWCDHEKIVITNLSGDKHVEANVDNIFGMGEFKKIKDVCYSENFKDGLNPHSKEYELISGYIPKRAVDDLGEESLVGKYFGKT